MLFRSSAESLYHALEGNPRQPKINIHAYEQLSNYWDSVRSYYDEFESGLKAPNTEVYFHEMPGGQYSNLMQQANAVGLGDRWNEVKRMFRKVNDMFGDIVKVTPSSKVIGDMALFMVQNNLTEDDVYEKGETIDFPNSVVEFAQGYIGQPYQGFPKELQRIILKGKEPINVRPGELMEPVDFSEIRDTLFQKLNRHVTSFDMISYALYPKVFMDYQKNYETYGDLSVLDTPTFFYGMRLGEEIEVEIEQGKTLIVKLLSISEARSDGTRVIFFELNGQSREVVIRDENIKSDIVAKPKVDPENKNQIGATMPGTVIKVICEEGEKVEKGDYLLITEAMKMETTIQAPFAGKVKKIHVDNGDAITANDLLIELE